MTLTEFLLARIAEDEAQANRSKADLAMNPNLRIPAEWVSGVADRVLAECEAKRRIVEHCEPDPLTKSPGDEYVLRLLALPYADRPGYREEWRP